MDIALAYIQTNKKLLLIVAIIGYCILGLVVEPFHFRLINGSIVSAYMVVLIVYHWEYSMVNNALVICKVVGTLLLGYLCGELLVAFFSSS